MIKKYFNDGLLQLAILLSLLRSDLNNYLNIQLHNNHNEIHEIILGPTSAYTQTNFHSNHWNTDMGFSHPKNVENDHPSILEELHSLGTFNTIQHDTNIAAWLVNQPLPDSLQTENENNHHNADEQEVAGENNSGGNTGNDELLAETVSAEDGASVSQEPEESEADSSEESEADSSGELTREDMDLIDILWQQDMDLGIGREVFDAGLRRDLEKEKEMELAKQREKEKKEAAEKKLQEAMYSLMNHTYVRDNETGEMLPAPSGSSGENYTEMQPPVNVDPETEPQEFSLAAAMRMLEQQSEEQQHSSSSSDVSQPPPPVLPFPALSPQQLQAIIESSQSNTNVVDAAHSLNPPPVQPVVEPPLLMRQSSIEQALEEMSNMLNLPLTSSIALPEVAVGNATFPGLTACNDTFDDTSTPLIHNTTLAPPADNLMNLTQPLAMPTLEDLMDLASLDLQPLEADEALPFEDALAPAQDMDTTLFPLNTTADPTAPVAMSSPGTQSSMGSTSSYYRTAPSSTPSSTQPCGSSSSVSSDSGYVTSSGFLDLLMNQNDDAFEEMDFSDCEMKPRQRADDASSDSAVSSMGSIASPTPESYQDLNETSSNFSDQMAMFDGMEGATGGSEDVPTKQEPKMEPYSPHYDFSTPDECPSMDTSSNYSDHNNSTFTLANKKHVKHNHTYPLQPGQQPRERKSDKKSVDMKIQMGRDAKRAKELRIPFTPEEIVHSSVERFSEMMQHVGLSDAQQQLIRDIRRRGKNKVAAQNCRKRKLDVISTLDDAVGDMRREKNRLSKQVDNMHRELDEYKAKLDVLYKEVFHSLRDDSGRPYDPDQYTLQQSADGNVFLMPRNVTEGQHKKDGKKHKGKRSK